MSGAQTRFTRGKKWSAFAAGVSVAVLGGALTGWRPAPGGSDLSPELARQIAQFRALRDDIRRDLDSLEAELAKRAAAPAAAVDPNVSSRPAAAPPGPDASAESPRASPPAKAPWRQDAERALEAGDVAGAVERLQKAADEAEASERSQIENLLAEARRALPKAVLASLQQLIADVENDLIEQWIVSGKAPTEWMRDFSDRRAAEAFAKAAVKLLPIAWHNRMQPFYAQRAVRSPNASSFSDIREFARFYLFRELATRHRQGDLEAEVVKDLVELYGDYGADGILPAMRGLLVAGMETGEHGFPRAVPLTNCEDAAVRGEFDLLSCRGLFDRCRRQAPELLKPLGAPHPLAGRWRGKENWQIDVDIPRGAVRFVNAKWKGEMNLEILKVGADYVAGYAFKTEYLASAGRSGPGVMHPFQYETLGEHDGVLRGPGEPGSVIGLTLLAASPETKTMDAYRRLEAEDPLMNEILDGDAQTWRDLSDVKKYRLFERYRQAATSP